MRQPSPAQPSWGPALHRRNTTSDGTVCSLRALGFVVTMEANLFRDQLTESINAALQLRNSGRTVLPEAEYVAEATNSEPNFSNNSDFCVKEAGNVEQSNSETVEKD
jgi:hypothetical protein